MKVSSLRALVAIGLVLSVVPLPARAAPLPPIGVIMAPGGLLVHPSEEPAPSGGRATGTDSPDVTTDPQTHIIYFVPADKPDEELDTAADGTLRRSVDALRAWFARETASAGAAALRPRIDLKDNGAYDITYVAGDQKASAYTGIAPIVDELIAKGFNAAKKRYLVYAAVTVDSPGSPGGVCGEGYYPLPGFQARPYATVYLDAASSCGAREFATGSGANGGRRTEAIAAHEWLHNEGVAPLVGPHVCPGSPYHVCTGPLWVVPPQNVDPVANGYLDPESHDVMFPIITDGLRDKVLDRGRDDYLDQVTPTTNLRDSVWLERV